MRLRGVRAVVREDGDLAFLAKRGKRVSGVSAGRHRQREERVSKGVTGTRGQRSDQLYRRGAIPPDLHYTSS